jgi:hypothetical protein
MQITLQILNEIPKGEVFRVVTTRIQRMHDPMKAELTFVCKKGHGNNDWAIYCHYSYKGVAFIEEQGDKVTSPDIIQSICPCDEDVLSLYRN